MKYALSKRVALGLMTAMIVASPVFAETTPSMSRPVDTKGRPQSTQSQAKDIKVPQDATAAEALHSQPNLLAPPSSGEETMENKAGETAQSNPEIAPYLNKTVTKISIEGNKEIPAEEIQKAVISKPGLPLTEESLAKDLQSIYAMGWFYDLRPSFTTVPEGVQVTYHVMENPKFTRLEVEGNTRISTEKIREMVNLPEGQMVNIREATAKLQQVEAEYKKAGYILARITDVKLLPDGTLGVLINEGIVEDLSLIHIWIMCGWMCATATIICGKRKSVFLRLRSLCLRQKKITILRRCVMKPA